MYIPKYGEWIVMRSLYASRLLLLLRTLSVLGLFVFALTILAVAPHSAQAQTTAVVTSTDLSVGGGVLHQGDRVVLQADTAQQGYFTITSGPAGISYPVKVSASHVAVASSTTKKVWHGVTTQRVALRSAPSSSAKIVGYLGECEAFTCAEFDAKPTWYVAKYNGKEVYFTWDSSMKTYWGSPDDKVVHVSADFEGVQLYRAPLEKNEYKQGNPLPAGKPLACLPFNSDFYFAKDSEGHLVFLKHNQVVVNNGYYSGTCDGYVKSGGLVLYEAPNEKAKKTQAINSGVQVFYLPFNEKWGMATLTKNNVKQYVYFQISRITNETSDGSTMLITTVNHAKGYKNPYDSDVLEYYKKGTIFEVLAEENGCYLVSSGGKQVWLYHPQVRLLSGPIKVSESFTRYNISFNDLVSQQYAKGGNVVYNNGTWIDATKSQLAYYMNPGNFGRNSTAYLQFLRLDVSTGVNPDELNKQLGDKSQSGILSGKGRAFSEAARTYGVNEAYLIAHAKLETGNGTSNLAVRSYYNPSTGECRYTPGSGFVQVYNMYGIGAYDNNAFEGGTRFAYEQRWFTPEEAIIGGAEFVVKSYLSPSSYTMSGQNTLYKMLFHPQAHAENRSLIWHQYATSKDWALAQTGQIGEMLADYSGGTYRFDVPRYR